MVRAMRRALVSLVLPLLVAVAAPGLAAAADRLPVTLTGTYELLAKDVVGADGDLHHVYSDVLRTEGKAVRLRLPANHGLRGGTRVRLSAQRFGTTDYSVTSVRQLSAASVPTTGTTSVLVILAYWSAPDSVTRARAQAQIFGDDHQWFREVSYGKLGLSGVVTPWVRIPAPTGGQCFTHAETMLANARRAAGALGATYDHTRYQRTILYFPRCTGSDSRDVAGWAYEPGAIVWLNGYMDRRTTVHEQGHSYGLGHARSYYCWNSAGTRISLGSSCTSSEYGDNYDAMGRSTYSAHFTGYRKDQLGWLGPRKRVLRTATTTFNLPPLERSSTVPVVVVANSPKVAGRSYWLEYRRPIGMDAKLPSGATGGVLVHLAQPGTNGWLLDPTPSDRSFTTAVVRPGTTWVAPDGVRVRVHSITSVQARVTVTGARPAPAVPSVPRNLVVKGADARISVSWSPPASTGGAPISSYVVTAASPGRETETRSVSAYLTTAVLTGLVNGSHYTVTVSAKNEGGVGPAATGYATPVELPPSVRLVTPTPDATVSGWLTVEGAATPNPQTESPVESFSVDIDGVAVVTNWQSTYVAYRWDTNSLPNGVHTVTLTAVDEQGSKGVGRFTVTVANPVPDVTITSPATGTTIDGDLVWFEATATVPSDPTRRVNYVEFYEVTAEGWERYIGQASSAPYRVPWRVEAVSGTRTVYARAYVWPYSMATSKPVTVTIVHPPATIAITSPGAESTVRGPSLPITADAAVTASGSAVAYVMFVAGGTVIAYDSTAPYQASWDTSAVTGRQTISATVVETSGRSYHATPVTVTVANALPVLTVTAPEASARVQAGTVELRGTAVASPGGVAPDRVVVTPHGGPELVAQVAPDGTWSLPWSTGPNPGQRWLALYAATPGGLRTPVQSRSVVVYHPEPVLTVHAPSSGVVVPHGTSVDLVVSAVPGANDPASVTAICVYSASNCDLTPDESGRYVLPLTSLSSGSYRTSIGVRLSDGYVWWTSGPSFVVAKPPGTPTVTAKAGDGSLTVSAYVPYYYEPVSLDGYVFTVDGESRTTTGAAVTFTGLTPGVAYDVTAVATNVVGSSPVGRTTGTPTGATTTGGDTPTTGFAPAFGLWALVRGRVRRRPGA